MTDINHKQRCASNPLSSVWVAASAGSGKTKVLTDRVLNLLLLNDHPEKLLCLTFTNAAAAEMSNRINRVLKKWAICSDDELVTEIAKISEREIDSDLIKRARQLFAKVLETPGGMKIMTIHSFCQSVLQRFPLEANVPPDFEVIDEITSKNLLKSILNDVLTYPELQQYLSRIVKYQNATQLVDLLLHLVSQRSKLMDLLKKNESLDQIVHKIKKYFNIDNYKTAEDVISSRFPLSEWETKKSKYLNQDGSVNARKKKKTPEEEKETAIAVEVAQDLMNLHLVDLTEALLYLTYAVLTEYQKQKHLAAQLDYNDLITVTKNLLTQKQAADWVLFKLDGGIDHILVDEAQDTNPDQWAIIRMLAEEFFSGEDYHDNVRTIFVVGDKKQSIYSFQGADPTEFERMCHFFSNRIQASENSFENISFNLSFRSTQPVLDLVNALLENPTARDGVILPDENPRHSAYRETDAGLVEIWPVEAYQKKEKQADWTPPIRRIQDKAPKLRLAEHIADKISHMIKSKEILQSKGRPIQPGDFLILVQSRNDFVTEMVRLLKERHIPVAGVDRLDLNTHIAIQDLLAAAKFALLPEDDLNLACLLKAPFINMSEDELFQAAYNREDQSLWQRVQALFPEQAQKLSVLLDMADNIPPYEFFAHILSVMGGRKAFLARLGPEANEAIDEFLNLTISFEKNNIPSLQNFVDVIMVQKKIEIKRDMESSQNAVRIMTVHGSKGLQGNIVFLPQTRYVTTKNPKIVWLDGELPFWLPNSKDTLLSQAAIDLAEQEKEIQKREKRRLLYVATTRACDRLYICGYDCGKTSPDNNWYDLIKNSLHDYSPDADGIIRIKSEQTGEIKKEDEKENVIVLPFPDWVDKPVPPEPIPPKPFSPSKPDNEEPAPDSPLTEGQALAMERGTFIHKLLQYLPTLPEEQWDRVIKRLKPDNIDVPENILTLLKSPEFAPIFKESSLAEVPVVGVWKNKAISGQIDRLVVLPNEVWIVDFKTNRHVPLTEKEAPALYREQLAAYRGLISQIFSDKVIRTYLLWTENLTLMEITHEN